jgi:uncharacterized protein (DUF433 family)
MGSGSNRKSEIASSPDVQGGLPVFAGTRVPIQTLLDYLADSYTIEDFVKQYPSVSAAQARRVLGELREQVAATDEL